MREAEVLSFVLVLCPLLETLSLEPLVRRGRLGPLSRSCFLLPSVPSLAPCPSCSACRARLPTLKHTGPCQHGPPQEAQQGRGRTSRDCVRLSPWLHAPIWSGLTDNWHAHRTDESLTIAGLSSDGADGGLRRPRYDPLPAPSTSGAR